MKELRVTRGKLLGTESRDLPVKEMLFFKMAYDGRGTLCQSIMVGTTSKRLTTGQTTCRLCSSGRRGLEIIKGSRMPDKSR